MFLSVQRDTLTKQGTPATPVNIHKFNVAKWLGDASWNPIKSTSSKNYYFELEDSPCQSGNGNKDNLCNSQRLDCGRHSFSESKCESPDNNSFAMFTDDRPGMNIADKENVSNHIIYPMEKNLEKSFVRDTDTENQMNCLQSLSEKQNKIQTTYPKVANPPKTSDILNIQPSFLNTKTFQNIHKETPEERSEEILPKLVPMQDTVRRQTKPRIWKTSIDPKSGQTYYYDLITRQTQWDKPLELVSKQEKRAIRKKDVSQREFFSNMEANILKCFQMGQIPGTSNNIPTNIEKNKSFVNTYLHNPNLVNTISSQVQQVDKRFVLLNKQVPNKATRNKSVSFEISNNKKLKNDIAKPVLTKHNTCGTMNVGPTMSAPDIDATIKVNINSIITCSNIILSLVNLNLFSLCLFTTYLLTVTISVCMCFIS